MKIPGFMDIKAVHFLTKCHTENSSQISHLCRLFFRQYSFSRHLRFMTTRIGIKSHLKTESFVVFESSRFVTRENYSSRRAAFALPTGVSTPLFQLRSLVNTNPRYLNVSTCCSVFPLSYRIHCHGCLETQCLNLFSADFRSCLVARNRKPIKCVLKTLLRRSTHVVQIRPHKANGSFCSSQQ